jgi:hypothetical protein
MPVAWPTRNQPATSLLLAQESIPVVRSMDIERCKMVIAREKNANDGSKIAQDG